ncbi:MAG: putative Ig domain-containing protein [Thiogranum sp.]
MTRQAVKLNLFMRLLVCMPGLFLASKGFAGAFIFAGELFGVDVVAHPTSYSGQGGTLTVRVCIDPLSANAAAMEIPVQNNITIYNRLQPTTGNLVSGANNNIPSGHVDFESVALHELGHCIGLAHVNAASESGLAGNNQNYTKATDGVNNQLDINPGADGIIGSHDDSRGDDVNLHWYRKLNNNPFTIDATVDSSSYARALSDLPVGHSFAANADRTLASSMGFANTEAVMQQLTFTDEAQRTLGHDDVATLLYAASGRNELAGDGDDYTINLEYGGISNIDCDVNLKFDNTQTGFAVCQAGGSSPPGSDHVSITSANIFFNTDFNWFFNTDTANQAPLLARIGNQAVNEGQSTSINLSATNPDGDTQTFSATGLPAFSTLTDHSNDTATLDINPLSGNAGTYPVTIRVTDNGLPALQDSETFDIVVSPPIVDSDGDGLSDAAEVALGTDPNSVDTDGDDLADGADGFVPLAALPGGVDADGDGFADGEQDFGTDPVTSNIGDVAPRGAPDNVLNAGDAVVLTRLVTGIITADALETALADLNADKQLNAADLLLLQQLLLSAP